MGSKRLAALIVVVLGFGWTGTARADDGASAAGTWEGQYTCGQGPTGMKLRVRETDGNLRAVLAFHEHPSGPDVPSGKFFLDGETDSDGSVTLDPVKWLDRPRGFDMIGLDGELTDDGDGFDGEVTGAGNACSTFSLERKGGPDSVEAFDVEVEDSEGSGFEPVDDQGFHSDFHKKHAGEIVFSSEPIPKEDHSDVTAETTFELGDAIYHRSFFEQSMGNTMRARDLNCEGEPTPSNDLTMTMYIQIGDAPREDWIEANKPLYFSEDEFDTWTSTPYYNDSLTGTEDREPTESDNAMYDTFAGKVLPSLDPGAHELTFHAIARCMRAERASGGSKHGATREVASGTIELEIESADQKQQFWAERGPRLPDAEHPDQETIAPAAKQRLDAKWSNEDVLRIVTTDSDWKVTTNERTGEPVRRSVPAKALVEKKKDGVCRLFEITIRQAYADDDFRDDVTIATGGFTVVPCAIE